MNKVTSLPWFIHKHDIGAKHATSIQGEKQNSLYMFTKASKSHPKRCGEPSFLDHLMDKRSSTIQLIFSNHVFIPTHKEMKKTEPLIPKG
jgi:hypothetical protein